MDKPLFNTEWSTNLEYRFKSYDKETIVEGSSRSVRYTLPWNLTRQACSRKVFTVTVPLAVLGHFSILEQRDKNT